MVRKLYELLGQRDIRPSPYCWRTRMALAHKGLDAEFVPVQLVDKERIAFSGQDEVPVLVDGESVVADSWTIACYLEDAYPDRPSLFGGATGKAGAKFINSWIDDAIHPAMFRLTMCDVHDIALTSADQVYFRATREKRLGMTLEAFSGNSEEHIAAFRKKMKPIRLVLKETPFLAGAAPRYADYIFFGSCKYMELCSPLVIFLENDPISEWYRRMLGLFDGLAGSDGAAQEQTA